MGHLIGKQLQTKRQLVHADGWLPRLLFGLSAGLRKTRQKAHVVAQLLQAVLRAFWQVVARV
ncbi:hypothetical protein FHY12_002094 [Xanthomonas arboricola]|nr:hypothetical protein [Xanthomonas euroxanthea]